MNSNPDGINRKTPIEWIVLRDRVGTCKKCGTKNRFKKWLQIEYPFPVLSCPECLHHLFIGGAVKDYFKERY